MTEAPDLGQPCDINSTAANSFHLQIDISGPESPALLTDITYTFTVFNEGPNSATFRILSDGLDAVGGGVACTDVSFDGIGPQQLDDGKSREYVFVTRCMIDTPELPYTVVLDAEVINDSGDDPDTTNNNFDLLFATLVS